VARAGDRHDGKEFLMEIVCALAIGILVSSGTWLLLRPRTFQVIIGLTLLSYAVNLLIFATGRLVIDRPAIVDSLGVEGAGAYADPVPQALVLTAIVIGFATTALFLVVLLVLRGLTGTDHVDGQEPDA
jgi:multicomponent K+:H+ antiporter subunit C